MQIKVNGNKQSFDDEQLNVVELLERMKYTSPGIVVKHNGVLINEDAFEKACIKDGDEVLVIHLFAGG